MYMIGHPTMALRIANQKIDEQVRDAEARRTARAVGREARELSATGATRPRRRIRARLRALTHTAS